MYDDFLCIADAITKDDNSYILTEIKATTSPDKERICDLAFQKWLLNGAAFRLRLLRRFMPIRATSEMATSKLDEIIAFTEAADKVNKEVINTPDQMRVAAKNCRTRSDVKRQTDEELIAVISPTINNDK